MKHFSFIIFSIGMTFLGQKTDGQKISSIESESKFASIEGKVVNQKDGFISGANVMLLRSQDSSLVRGIVSIDSGRFVFKNVQEGSYLIGITHAGYQQTFSRELYVTNKETKLIVDALVLQETSEQLSTVNITASRKAAYEQKIDRLVINVAASPTNAGNTALEVLERSPGISVDHQNNIISMNGKSGVKMMINGKITYMPMDAVVQMLSGMSSGNIEKIELINTPPANFDAEGNAGYINIVFKNNPHAGTNGFFSGTLGYGKGWVEEASISLNHRNGKLNLYGGFSYSRIVKPFPSSGYSEIHSGTSVLQVTDNSNRRDTTRNMNGRIGLDYQLSSKTIIGVLFSSYDNRYTQSEKKISRMVKNHVADSGYTFNNYEMNHWSNYSGNINLQHNFSKRSSLQINLDYIRYYNNQPVNYYSKTYNGQNNLAYTSTFRSGKITPIHFWVGALDYSKKINDRTSFDLGFKQTFTTFRNDVSFSNYVQNNWIIDPALSARFNLNENYTAAYGSMSFQLNKKTEAKTGLRYEYTNSNLGSDTKKDIVNRHYGNLFPSLFVVHHINDDNTLALAYNIRITRPTLNDLAPFTYYFNARSLLTGNPALQPAIATTIKSDYTYKQNILSLSYSTTKNSIASFQPSVDSVTKKTVYSAVNLVKEKLLFAMLSVPLKINKWWNMQNTLTASLNKLQLNYKGSLINQSVFNYKINTNQSFVFPKMWSAELSAFYQSPSLFGIAKVKAYGSLDMGIKKKLGTQKGSLIFNFSNILNTQKFIADVNYPDQNLVAHFSLQFTQPTFKLTYLRSFGNDKLKEKRERSTGAEEEKSRVQ